MIWYMLKNLLYNASITSTSSPAIYRCHSTLYFIILGMYCYAWMQCHFVHADRQLHSLTENVKYSHLILIVIMKLFSFFLNPKHPYKGWNCYICCVHTWCGVLLPCTCPFTAILSLRATGYCITATARSVTMTNTGSELPRVRLSGNG